MINRINTRTIKVGNIEIGGNENASKADIGIAGGIDEAVLFKKGKVIRKIPQERILTELKQEILEMIKKD